MIGGKGTSANLIFEIFKNLDQYYSLKGLQLLSFGNQAHPPPPPPPKKYQHRKTFPYFDCCSGQNRIQIVGLGNLDLSTYPPMMSRAVKLNNKIHNI